MLGEVGTPSRFPASASGERLLDAITRAGGPRNPGYGAQTWLNRPQAGDGQPLFPGAPRSVFSLNGHLGQYVVVAPAQRLTVVRLGKTDDGVGAPVRARIADLVKLFVKAPA